MKRREFLSSSLLTAAVLASPTRWAWAADEKPAGSNAAALARRQFGRHAGVNLSMVGFGGLVLARLDQDASNRLVAEAVECGCNYFDVAPKYGDAEVKMGPALAPYRKNVFLACKTAQRTAEGAKMEFERSLERLKTDRLDLYQLHHIRKVDEDVDAVFGPGGAWEFIQQAKKDGRVRFVGFSAHTEEAAMAALDKFEFDSVMFPISLPIWLKAGFGPKVVEKAKAKGAAVMSIKTLCRQRWPNAPREGAYEPFKRMWYQPFVDPEEQALSVRWTLTQGTTSLLPPGDAALHRDAFARGLDFKPLTDADAKAVAALGQKLDPLFQTGKEP
jgi:aryl-alcohol dehydrogenase-like predicted oxidoreductase